MKGVVAIINLAGASDLERRAVAELALSMYIGERCRFCPHVWTTLEELKGDVVYAGYHEHGRLAHKACWDAQSPEERARIEQEIAADREARGGS